MSIALLNEGIYAPSSLRFNDNLILFDNIKFNSFFYNNF